MDHTTNNPSNQPNPQPHTHDCHSRHTKRKPTTKRRKKPPQRQHRHPKKRRQHLHHHKPTSKQTVRLPSPPTLNTKGKGRGRQKPRRAKEKSEVPVPHALHRHNGPPPTLGAHYTYKGTGLSAPCDTQSTQAIHPAASTPARQYTGPNPPLPNVAALPALPLYRLLFPHPDRP